MTQQQSLVIKIALGIITLGLLIAAWVFLSQNQANNVAKDGTAKLTSLQTDAQVTADAKKYAYTIQESWVKDAGFTVKKRLYPVKDSTGVTRFNVPTEYFEVALSTDSEKGATTLNIVAATIRTSGITATKTPSELDTLFEKREIKDTYDTVRALADGRTKAEIASGGCLVSASAFEKEKLRKFVDLLFARCQDVLTKK